MRFIAQHALLPDGWTDQALIEVADSGDILSIEAGSYDADAERISGWLMPGMPNLHSHAFQRALAGRAERNSARTGNFWSWREQMYRLALEISPEDLYNIACALYIELIRAGYTSVAEFHYLHHNPAGNHYAELAEMGKAITSAARTSGIGLTHIPVLYQSSGFGGRSAKTEQRRFVNFTDGFNKLIEAAAADSDDQIAFGVGFHSLRAVTREAMHNVLDARRLHWPHAPVHIHVAEQKREVDECIKWCGHAPVEWLMNEYPVAEDWCLVHATQATPTELEAIVSGGATVALCPTTEANLGDGLFALADYLAAGGRWSIGSDSHVCVDPFEELRWLEYGQRLETGRRNLSASEAQLHTGARLWGDALRNSEPVLGRKVGALSPGYRADLMVIDPGVPRLAGRSGDQLLDGLIFAGRGDEVQHVMVGGTVGGLHGEVAGKKGMRPWLIGRHCDRAAVKLLGFCVGGLVEARPGNRHAAMHQPPRIEGLRISLPSTASFGTAQLRTQ